VFGHPNCQLMRVDVAPLTAARPPRSIRLALWQSPTHIDPPIRILPTAEAQTEGAASPGMLKKWLTLPITPNTSTHRDLVFNGLGWLAVAADAQNHASVTVHVCDHVNMRTHVRDCVFSPYWSFQRLMQMRAESHNTPNSAFDFSLAGARRQEEERRGFFLNEQAVREATGGDVALSAEMRVQRPVSPGRMTMGVVPERPAWFDAEDYKNELMLDDDELEAFRLSLEEEEEEEEEDDADDASWDDDSDDGDVRAQPHARSTRARCA
jgi:hypothetical protein